MTTAFEQLQSVARSARAPKRASDRRIVAATGLPVVSPSPHDAVRASVVAELSPLVAAADHAGLATRFERAFADGEFTGSGYRIYRVVYEHLIEAAVPALAGAAAVRRWELAPADPAAAVVYATVTLARADRARRSYGRNSALAGRGALIEATVRARSILVSAEARGQDHWMWRYADFLVTNAAVVAGLYAPTALTDAFAAVKRLDPYDFGIYDDRTLQIVGDGGAIAPQVDKLATSAAALTRDRFGDLLYARIYDRAMDHIEASVLLDRRRLMAAFDDWYARFPTQALANRHAAHAHAIGDDRTLRRLFRDVLIEIHPQHWFTRAQPVEAWRSIVRA